MNLNRASSERDAWLFPIGPYRFGRINVVVRWIKSDLGGLDRFIPLR
jgi:hypothetical protein